jgi:hypothetical protein
MEISLVSLGRRGGPLSLHLSRVGRDVSISMSLGAPR